jgi:hypothetical protein
LIRVLPAFQLDNQALLVAHKVYDVLADRGLASELAACHLAKS